MNKEELKTLKDLEKRELKLEDYASESFKEGTRVYTKKRIDRFKDELKAEVVKWVKDIQFRYETQDKVTFAGNWIMHFFNLTESDLKELKGVKK